MLNQPQTMVIARDQLLKKKAAGQLRDPAKIATYEGKKKTRNATIFFEYLSSLSLCSFILFLEEKMTLNCICTLYVLNVCVFPLLNFSQSL